MPPTDKQTCFVVMPFSATTQYHTADYWTTHYNAVLRPAIEQDSGLIAERSAPLRGDLLRDIIAKLITSPIVLADITDSNANVYWELGVRESFRNGTIIVAQNGTKLPFDISGRGVLFYETSDPRSMGDLRKAIGLATRDALDCPDKTDSPVLESISGRSSLYQILHREQNYRRLKGVLQELDRAFLDMAQLDQQAGEISSKAELHGKYVAGIALRTHALDLLLADRYADADGQFYRVAYEAQVSLHSLNDWLTKWPVSCDEVTRKLHTQVIPLARKSCGKLGVSVLYHTLVLQGESADYLPRLLGDLELGELAKAIQEYLQSYPSNSEVTSEVSPAPPRPPT